MADDFPSGKGGRAAVGVVADFRRRCMPPMTKTTERSSLIEGKLRDIESVALREDISDDVKKHLASLIFDRDKDQRSLQLEERKWYSSTPLVVALTGLITIAANFAVTYLLNRQTASSAVTMEQLRNEFSVTLEKLKGDLQLSYDQSAHALGIKDEEKRFEFEVVRSELSRTEITQPERASILLFLVRSGVLNDLNKSELEAMAREGSVPELSPPPGLQPSPRSLTPQDLADLFNTLIIPVDKLPVVKSISDRIIQNQSRYQEVQKLTDVPWQIIGTLHYLETSGDFSVHLNGDPLAARTVSIPMGQPASGNPPIYLGTKRYRNYTINYTQIVDSQIYWRSSRPDREV